jgi:hypothetical protein
MEAHTYYLGPLRSAFFRTDVPPQYGTGLCSLPSFDPYAHLPQEAVSNNSLRQVQYQ